MANIVSTPDAEQEAILAQLATAAALRKQGMSGNDGSGMAGKVYMRGNPWGNIAQTIAGAYVEDRARGQQAALSKARDAERQQFLSQMPSTSETAPQFGPGMDGGSLPDVVRDKSPELLADETRRWATAAPRGMEGVQQYALQQAISAPQQAAARRDQQEARRLELTLRAEEAAKLAQEKRDAQVERDKENFERQKELRVLAASLRAGSGGGDSDLDRRIKEARLAALEGKLGGGGKESSAAEKARHNANLGMASIDDAIAELDNPAAKNALGLVNLIPGAEKVRQYTDPEGIAARATVSNIGSMKLHDRSGATVTVAEMPRLAPFIPSPADSPAAAKVKLGKMRAEYDRMQTEWATPKGAAAPAPAAPGAYSDPGKEARYQAWLRSQGK